MPKKILLFFLLFPFSSFVFAQVSFKGIVVGDDDNMALPGATITNSTDSLIAITDEEGRFHFNIPQPDSIIFKYVGYAPKRMLIAKEAVDVRVALSPQNEILEEVKIIAYESGRPIKEVAGGIAVIQKKDIERFGQTSMVPALSQVPGVKMEQRSTGSYRISIRGSALRAPFDVRNIKVYWNNIPITEPGGNTPFNLLDNINFEKVEVVKGPSGSIYGAGIGGVVNIESPEPNIGEKYIKAGFSSGSYGLKRYTMNANIGSFKKAINFTYAHQKQEGYRVHSGMERTNVGINTKINTGERSSFSTDILYTDLFYEIPGGLTKKQFDEDPQQARPGTTFTLGSEEANASISVKNLLAGISYDLGFAKNGSLLTALYTNIADFDNPFNLDYKREAQQSYGGRIRANIWGRLIKRPTKLTVGGEYQFRFAGAGNYGNNFGQVDTLNFYDEIRSKQFMLFGQYEVFLANQWILTTGLSANSIEYDIFRTMDSQGSSGRIVKRFAMQWMPRISLVKSYDNLSFHSSISYGFSPPTLEEVRTNEGSINTDIEPEKGINYEVGIRGNGLQKKLFYDITAFFLSLSKSIVDYPSDRGTDLFRNTGSANQKGVEAALAYTIIDETFSAVTHWSVNISYAYHHFRFNDYIQGEEDYSGNIFTGVSPHTLWSGMQIESNPGIYGNINYNYTDAIPLDDANEVYADSYHLLLAKLGYKRKLAKDLLLDIHIGADNLLNQRYSLGNDLNAIGGRFYQPAPERNYYGGISLNYRFR